MSEATENGLELVSGRGMLRVVLSGLSGEDPVKLLEDAAGFLRNQPHVLDGRDPDENLDLLFKRVDVGDFVILTIKA